MELSVREAAELLGCSTRTLRARLARGEIRGHKRDGAWRIARSDLPLTEAQRDEILSRAEQVRETVEGALPRLTLERGSSPRRSVLDLEPLRHVRALLATWDALDPVPPCVADARGHLQAAVTELCRGAHAFDPASKVAAFREARDRLSRAVAALILDSGAPLDDERKVWVETLEGRALAALGGLLRWAERLGSRRRNAR